MKSLTFCRISFLSLIFCLSSSYGDITSYQTRKQDTSSSKQNIPSTTQKTSHPQGSKCPSGGCYEGPPLEDDYPLLVFISFSMPKTSLLSFAKELEVYGGAFAVRGLPNDSFAEFFNRLNQLKEIGIDAPILIDPDSFEGYEISEVPTIVLRGEKNFDKMTGNVPISCVLETFAERGEEKLLAKELQCISFNISKQCTQDAPSTHDKHCIQNNKSIQSKQGIQSLKGAQ